MFKNIYVPVDNSDYSNACTELALDFASRFDATVTASHVYAAKMHDVRFRQMESGLPEEYQDEQELEKQRAIHDQLITKGMEVITDSYLDVPRFKCKTAGVPFVGKSLEGRNWVELVRDIKESKYDLVIMGALGLGAIRDSQIGTVCERVVRRIETDTLIVKNVPELHGEDQGSGKIVVAVDGSGHSFGGLMTGIAMAKALNRPLEVISTFDPYFHYAMFNSLTGVLSKDAAKVFKFEQQEKLHEDIIDKGLAKIYQSHLEVSRKLVEDEGMECTLRLLDGKVFEKVLQYAREEKPWLLIMGRIGVHSGPEMDIGGNTENLMRLVPCNVLLASKVFKPPIDLQAEES
ncbi:MAG: universal stress protein, partial [Nitrospinaceae bacterium]